MSYPAFTEFFADPERTAKRICVFMAVQPPFLSFSEPRDAKVDAVQSLARISTRSTGDAIAWMVRRGYLVEHSRDERGIRRVTLAWARDPAIVSKTA